MRHVKAQDSRTPTQHRAPAGGPSDGMVSRRTTHKNMAAYTHTAPPPTPSRHYLLAALESRLNAVSVMYVNICVRHRYDNQDFTRHAGRKARPRTKVVRVWSGGNGPGRMNRKGRRPRVHPKFRRLYTTCGRMKSRQSLRIVAGAVHPHRHSLTNVQHPATSRHELQDGQYEVVDVTKSKRPIRHAVVHATAPVYSHIAEPGRQIACGEDTAGGLEREEKGGRESLERTSKTDQSTQLCARHSYDFRNHLFMLGARGEPSAPPRPARCTHCLSARVRQPVHHTCKPTYLSSPGKMGQSPPSSSSSSSSSSSLSSSSLSSASVRRTAFVSAATAVAAWRDGLE
ncbi:hypothetical protein Vafri_320 [Volvox africanus]|nr:hypothetical protein Vafri_320 [Volvox africanus]